MAQIAWEQADATVYSCDEVEAGRALRPQFRTTFAYEVDGHFHSGEFIDERRYAKDEIFKVLYDPADPDVNEFTEAERTQWRTPAIAVLVVLVVVGLVAVVLWGELSGHAGR